MLKNFVITNENKTIDGFSFSWDEKVLTITHELPIGYSVTLLDSDNKICYFPMTLGNSETEITFENVLADDDQFRIIFMSLQNSYDESLTEYYSGTKENILLFCKSLDISEDRLASVNPIQIEKYQRIVDDTIDGYLCEYYFIPLTPYNQAMPDGSVKLTFPGKIRFIAIQWTAGLVLQSEFQNMEPNVHESGVKFVEEAKKEMQSMVDFSTRIPGQRRKHPCPTMPPNLSV